MQVPLGSLAPLRGPVASPAGIMRGSLHSDMGSSVDSGVADRGEAQVRLFSLEACPEKQSVQEVTGLVLLKHFKDSVCDLSSVLKCCGLNYFYCSTVFLVFCCFWGVQ